MTGDVRVIDWSSGKGLFGTFEWLDVEDLSIESAYQRQIIKAHVKKIASNFRKEYFGVLLCCRRPDGSLLIADGQQRHAAAKIAGVKIVPCWVIQVGSSEDEARIFEHVNGDTRRISQHVHHRARVEYKVTADVALDFVLQRSLLRTSDNRSRVAISAVDAALRLIDVGDATGEGSTLETVLLFFRHVWLDGQCDWTRPEAFCGAALFHKQLVKQLGKSILDKDVRENMRATSLQKMLADGEKYRTPKCNDKALAVCKAMTAQWNPNRTTNRLKEPT